MSIHMKDYETTRGAGSLNAPKPGFRLHEPNTKPSRIEQILIVGAALVLGVLMLDMFLTVGAGL